MEIVQTMIKCPHCKLARLTAIVMKGNPIGYLCKKGCKSEFDFTWYFNSATNVVSYVAKRRNPEYQSAMTSDKWIENLAKDAELRKKGILPHTDNYVIAVKKVK